MMRFSLPIGLLALLISTAPLLAQNADPAQIERGKYVATMGDCAACHTAPKMAGADFAGGYALNSPLGTIWSTNITPSKQYGIGNYSYEDFVRAVREGLRKDGSHLYPAMPYDAYAGISDDDMQALYAYFMQGVKPVDAAPVHVTELAFPFNLRFSMIAWNLIYAGGKPFTPDAKLNDEQNRGKYLVDTLGHCASCHSPRGLLMGAVSGEYLRGGDVGPWHAPDITGNVRDGIGSWSQDEIVAYLKTGRASGKGQAAGPMAEAVQNSLQYMEDSDLKAIAAYLKTVNVTTVAGPVTAISRTDVGAPRGDEAGLRGLYPQNSNDSLKSAADLYSGYCASCHQPNGTGSDNQLYPSLYRNSATGSANASNLIATILFGVEREANGHSVLMPHFGKGSYVAELSNQQIADIANYVLKNWGNPVAAKVTPEDVQVAREGGPVAPLARLQPFIPALMAIAGVVVLAIIAAFFLRRRRKSASV